jgi:quercetin dioxygenase-like cupin family protein
VKNTSKRSCGEWVDVVDPHEIVGHSGRIGACSITAEGKEIGADLMEMQSGSAFPPHMHPGDHLLYIIDGKGAVVIDGVDHAFQKGDTVYIPAEYPHGFKNPAENNNVVTLVAFGYPHTHVGAVDRMKLVDP